MLAAVLFSLVLASCSDPEVPPAATDMPSASDTDTTAFIDVIRDGKSEFSFIRPDACDSLIVKAVADAMLEINRSHGIYMDFNSDWSVDNRENNTVESNADVHEILIGNTNRAESRTAIEEYRNKHGYLVKYVNGKIVIWGTTAELTIMALDYFCDTYILDDEEAVIPDTLFYFCDFGGEGTPVNSIALDYKIIYPVGVDKKIGDSAYTLSSAISKWVGVAPEVAMDSKYKEDTGKEILINATSREGSAEYEKSLNYMDYGYKISGDKIYISGGSPLSTVNAVDKFIHDLNVGVISTLDEPYEFKYSYDDLIKDSIAFRQDSFVPVWANDFITPEWMLDFDEKLYAITKSGGRMASDSHRGDIQHYPENSLEGILSALLLGADVVEIDIRLTKDNVMVLMHDEKMTRATNVSAKMGKNGLPSSVNVRDWTYEQLLELNLMFNGSVTEYKIPTVYEAIMLFKNRGFVHFDCKLDEIDKNGDVYHLAQELNSKECFAYYYGISTMKTWVNKDKSDTEFAQYISKLDSYLAASGNGLRKRDFALIAEYGDGVSGWTRQFNEGKQMIFTNHIYDLCRYIAANQQPFSIPQ